MTCATAAREDATGMGCLSTTTVALLFWGLVCLPEASGFVAPRGVVLWKHAAHSRTAVSMTAEVGVIVMPSRVTHTWLIALAEL